MKISEEQTLLKSATTIPGCAVGWSVRYPCVPHPIPCPGRFQRVYPSNARPGGTGKPRRNWKVLPVWKREPGQMCSGAQSSCDLPKQAENEIEMVLHLQTRTGHTGLGTGLGRAGPGPQGPLQSRQAQSSVCPCWKERICSASVLKSPLPKASFIPRAMKGD